MYQSIRPFLSVIPMYDMPLIVDNDSYTSISSSGPPGPQGPQGQEGPAGVSVVSAYVTTNPGDLILVLSDGTEINAGNVKGPGGPEGPDGPQGPMGPQGPQGPKGDPCGESACQTVLVSEDYESTIDDCYIGVDSNRPVTITLPSFAPDGHQVAIKAEMGPPMGNRKITIVTSDGKTIDGDDSYVMTVPYECVHLLSRSGNWNVI